MSVFNIHPLLTLCLGLAIGFAINGNIGRSCGECSSAASAEPAKQESAPFLAGPSASTNGPLSNGGGSVYAGGVDLGDPDRLIAHIDTVMDRIKASMQVLAKEDCGARFVDAMPLLGMADMAQVDVMLESGTAGGRSTEIMSNFFQGTHVQIVTVDFGSPSKGGQCAQKTKDTHQRLKNFTNIRLVIGDSFKVFPKLIKEFKGKRIGLFIDGPKRMAGVRLCMQSLKASSDVKFCAFHDIRPASPPSCDRGMGAEAYTYMSNWTRSGLRSCCDDNFLSHFNIERCDSCVAIVAGRDTYPLGMRGDF